MSYCSVRNVRCLACTILLIRGKSQGSREPPVIHELGVFREKKINGVRSLEKCAHCLTQWSEVAGGLQNLLGFVVPRLAPRFVQGTCSQKRGQECVRRGEGTETSREGAWGLQITRGARAEVCRRGQGLQKFVGEAWVSQKSNRILAFLDTPLVLPLVVACPARFLKLLPARASKAAM
ncbi:unnamed protein product [Effrenium voratum]|nr:unnamed protein product [Effrenium voratum]